MVEGIGIDIIEIERINKALSKSRFLDKVFTDKEIEYFKSTNYNINTIAGSFAAKEAAMKVLGTGLRGFKWVDIEVYRDELGKPNVILYNGARGIAEKRGISQIMISISHSKEYAVAQAIGI